MNFRMLTQNIVMTTLVLGGISLVISNIASDPAPIRAMSHIAIPLEAEVNDATADNRPLPGSRAFAWSLFEQFQRPGKNAWGNSQDWRTKRDICLQLGNPACPGDHAPWIADTFDNLVLHGLAQSTQAKFEILSDKHPVECKLGHPCTASAVLFNRNAWYDITTSGINHSSTLQSLISSPANPHPVTVPRLRNGSVIVKTLWEIVSPSVPIANVWDPTNQVRPGNDGALGEPSGWPSKYVKVDLSGEPCQAHDYLLGSKVPINCFRWILIDKNNISNIDTSALGNSESVAPGDFIILVGVHIIIKQNNHWVWSTFWWTNRPNYASESYPNYGDQRPQNLEQRWSHYVMDTTWNNARKPLFNPYIEGPDAHTGQLNCIRCHTYAVYPAGKQEIETSQGSYPFGIPPQDNGRYFNQSVQTDFLWSLVTKYFSSSNN